MTDRELPGFGGRSPTPSESAIREAVGHTLDVLRRELRLLQQEVAVLSEHPTLSPPQRLLAIGMREQLIQILIRGTGHMALQQSLETDRWPLTIPASEFSRSWLGHHAWCVLPRLIEWKEIFLRSCVEAMQRGEHSDGALLPDMRRVRGEIDELLSLKRQSHQLTDPIPTAKGWL